MAALNLKDWAILTGWLIQNFHAQQYIRRLQYSRSHIISENWDLRTLHINLSRIISMYLASRQKIRKKKEWWKCLCSCMQEGKGMQCHWCITNWQFKYSHAVAFCKCATKWTTGPQDHNNNNNNIPKEHQFTKRLFRQIFQSNCHSSCIYMYQNKQHYCSRPPDTSFWGHFTIRPPSSFYVIFSSSS